MCKGKKSFQFINFGDFAGDQMMKKSPHLLLNVIVLSVIFVIADGYRPVIIVHGLFDGPRQFIKLASFINKTHPGTNVTTIDMYDDMASLKPLWQQVRGVQKSIGPIMENAKDGIHLICFSQGGLVCRGVIATLPRHNVHSLIFLSSPLSGQYGITSYLRHAFPDCFRKLVYQLCYNIFGQKISICNFWNDPHQREKYLKSNKYLAPLNGEINHPNLTAWREHFLDIKQLVLIGGPDDGVITPWQSSQFGFYNSNETVVEMKQQDWYQTDVFGLKTLDSRGDLAQCVFSDVEHINWHSNFTVYENCIEKWLT
ncbi:lysosomal thioesterase PPT2-A-like [Clarias gariepinus]|uniref:lysosomal thioesterase PPT2-A-like n=1 Tax=Clarias gariepinus TaxID=13013 RepID=UPI00234C68BC|nr:lysosomal thioesterase PPT2-A-like [Clarias gariepinus]